MDSCVHFLCVYLGPLNTLRKYNQLQAKINLFAMQILQVSVGA